MDSLTFLTRYLGDGEQRRELLLRTLQQFIQQGILAKKASDSVQSTHKVRPSHYYHLIVMWLSCDFFPILAGHFKFIQSGTAVTHYCRGQLPYSQKLSWVKTFTNFAVLPAPAKVLSANFSVRGLGECVGFSKTWKFYSQNALLYRIRESFLPQKFLANSYILLLTVEFWRLNW